MDAKKNVRSVLIRVHRQRPLVLLLAALLSVMMVLGSTYAWFTSSDELKNQFRTPDLDFSYRVIEKFIGPGTVQPDQAVEKTVNVKNTGTQAGFARVLVFPEIIAEDGQALEAIPGVTFTFKDSHGNDTLGITDWAGDGNLWADGGDGYFYYLGLLESGETTLQPLFTHVTLADNLPAEYENASMTIHVKAEAAETDKYRSSWWETNDTDPLPGGFPWLDIDTALQEALGN